MVLVTIKHGKSQYSSWTLKTPQEIFRGKKNIRKIELQPLVGDVISKIKISNRISWMSSVASYK
jgi:hypothetical protein